MEAADSEGESPNRDQNHNNNNNQNSNEGQSKPKRQMKTPFQLQNLEKAYASETYPSEATRAELSDKLGLSDRQLQMWFCHRRLKDKKETPAKRPLKAVVTSLPESPENELRVGPEAGGDYGSGSGSGSSLFSHRESRKVGKRNVGDDVFTGRRYYESPRSIMELRVIECVEAQLGEPLRDDGPILGMEFDPLPPDAFGAPIAMMEQQKRSGNPYGSKADAKALHNYQFLEDQSDIRSDAYGQVAQSRRFHDMLVDSPTTRTAPFMHGNEQLSRTHGVQSNGSRFRLSPQQVKHGHGFSSPPRDEDSAPQRESSINIRINAQIGGHPIFGPESSHVVSDGRISQNDDVLRVERKRKGEEARMAKEVGAHDNRFQKELEKQDNLRRKNEERNRKEMEKLDRERRKEEERLMREKQKEEERLLREQRREMERMEKFQQKQKLRAEKIKQKEEIRREKEDLRRKAAVEKATARRIAKESMELIEDEQLELMELAAASKGLPSIINLDYDTLQNLESFKGLLSAFPPKSVTLKRPFSVQPWINSPDNIGNLLMVWRFLMNFADVLGLWPFTLDEFVQAFHDHDSRLLGEIHVALLKSIIKDIEDVARTPSTGLGMNQNSSASSEGGHPQIVEGAYVWGFDIRNWQHHLNPVTWPEIFRQLALSAGFGPQLKKRNVAWANLHDSNKGNGCKDVISTLRNGSAAENAVALMQEKGLLLPRRSRHRLTPGTVKFAAFHVLSLEGSKGLTVLQLADKIQRSGLRDLRTSKTPEASISVALTRDTKLFERIAPSTYCVRTPYRKDPTDAEAILLEALKKIQIFENGFLIGEDADVERDEDSEGDADEDPEVDDITITSANKNADHITEANICSESGRENFCNDVMTNLQNDVGKDFLSFPLSGSKDINCPGSTIEQYVTGEDIAASNLDQENIEIDESKSGESWVQGLAEGEYFSLSVEERLNALVALIGVANEGNSIRAVLEDRLEAVNALKKQMWTEAQVDKSRLKEEIITKLEFSSVGGSKPELQLTSSVVEGSQSPLPAFENKINEASPSTTENHEPFLGSQNVQDHPNSLPSDRTFVVQNFSLGPDNVINQQHGNAPKRLRSILKSYISHRAEEMYVYRSLPLGQDRRHNRYWQFVASASRNDPGSGRIFVESHDGNWRLIDSEGAFDTLLTSLDTRGIRESHLRVMLQKIETPFKETVRKKLQCANIVGRSGVILGKEDTGMGLSPDRPVDGDSPSSTVCGLDSDTMETSSFRIELGRNSIEKKAALKRYQDFQKWMWKECFNSSLLCAMKLGKRCTQLLDICDFCLDSYFSEDTHCHSCHQTFGTVSDNFNTSQHATQCEEKRKLDVGEVHISPSSLPLGIRLLKALLASIEVSVPPEAIQSFWTEDQRKKWGLKLNASSSTKGLLQILTLCESIIKRECLSSNFETTKKLLHSHTLSRSAVDDFANPGSVSVLPWIPQTTAAVALRLFELDASIIYVQRDRPFEDKENGEYQNLPSRYASLEYNKEVQLTELDQDGQIPENFAYLDSGHKRRRGGRERGRGKWQGRVSGSRSLTGKRNARYNGNLNLGLRGQGQRSNGQGSGRGRRTVRKRRVEKRYVEETFSDRMADTVIHKSSGGLRSNLDEWGSKEIGLMDIEDADNSNSMEAGESDDNAQATGYEVGNWGQEIQGGSNRWSGDLVGASDQDVDASEDDNGIGGVEDEDSEGDGDMSEGSDGVADRYGNEGSELAVSEDFSD